MSDEDIPLKMTDYSLYLVTSSDRLPAGATVESTVREAVRAGVKIVQLREKNLSTKLFLERARALRQICQPPVKLIINDRIDIALASGADGVHLGQDDMPLVDAKKIFRGNEIAGISVNTIDEAVAAVNAGATYLGVGTCWPTGTKAIPDHKIIGLLARRSSLILHHCLMKLCRNLDLFTVCVCDRSEGSESHPG